MARRPQVSIVIPMYNAASTISRTLASIAAQTHFDYEVVIVDDGSTDASCALVEEHAFRHAHTRLVRHGVNRGVAAARNTGVQEAAGDWIAMVDADDEIAPTMVAKVIEVPASTDVIVFAHEVVKPDGTRKKVSGGAAGEYSSRQASLMAMEDRIASLSGGAVMRRSLMVQVPFPEGMRRFEDMVTNIALFSRARRVQVSEEAAYRYVMSSGSATWGRSLDPDEVDQALSYLDSHVDDLGPDREWKRARQTLTVLCYLIGAQSAMRRRAAADTDGDHRVVRACSERIGVRHILASVRVRPDYAAAAMLLRLFPGAYGAVYRRYASSRYGM